MNVYKGIDVSKWQGEINWSKVKNDGIDFAMLRATFGSKKGQVDTFFEKNYKGAKEVGISVGAYHYSYAVTVEEAKREADHCYSVLKGKKFEYPIAFDMEEGVQAKLGKEKISQIVKAFCEKMENYGYYVCIYSNLYWLNNFFTNEILKKYDVWLAQWTKKPTFKKPYGIWQKSSTGRVDGVNGNVDLDESYKNYPAIMKFNGLNGYGAQEPVEPAKRGFRAGQKVILKNSKLYSSCVTKKVSNYLTGTYYIYDGVYFEGRYRVTDSLSNVERKPMSKYVTGFVDRYDMEKADV